MRRGVRGSWERVVALVACVPAACGPSTEASTFVDVTLDADGCTRAMADEITVIVFDHEGVEELGRIVSALEDVELPTGVRVVAGSEGSPGFRLVAELSSEGVPVSRVSAQVSFAPGEGTTLPLLFDDACLGIECGGGRTCVAGRCVGDVMPESEAPHATPAACPAHVFVDSAEGSDTSTCGTIDAPCASLQHAVAQRSGGRSGTVIEVHGERSYTADTPNILTIPAEHGGGARARLVIRAWPGTGRPMLDGRSTNRKGIDLGAEHVVIQGLEITGATEHGITVNGSTDRFITIRDCILHGNGAGPSMFDNRGGVIVNNYASDILIEDCELRDNHSAVSGENALGARVNLGTRVVIRNNRITGNDRGVVSDSSSELTIEGNTIARNGGVGIQVGGNAATIVRNRICDQETGIHIASGGGTVLVEHNSVTGTAGPAILIVDRPAVRVRANIVAFGGTGIEVVRVDIDDSHDLYFGNAMDRVGFTPDQPDTDVLADPLFVDPSECDLALAEGSPARGAGPDGSSIGAP